MKPALRIALLTLFVATPVGAMIPGGGNVERDCWLEFEAPGRTLNFPRAPRSGREIRCFDGEAGCDVDGEVDGKCTFDIDVCLANSDPGLPECTPSEVEKVTVKRASGDPGLASLQAAIDALLPVRTPTCTIGETFEVFLRTGTSGKEKWNRERVAIRTVTAGGKSIERLRLACVPNEWANHGFDRRNSRGKPQPPGIDSSNVGDLEPLWSFDVAAQPVVPPRPRNNVTSTPTVMDGRVFVTSASGFVFALDTRSGRLLWRYEAVGIESFGQVVPGIYASPTLTADGRVVVADADARVHVLDQRTGERLWRTSVGNRIFDHIWSSPVVANGRVYVGVASHFDDPCVRGRVVALDLEDGSEIWRTYMVPERVCDNDLDRECTSDAECGLGSCIDARGAGVTATPAIDARAENLYVSTVGCGSFPSLGHSESILKLDAETGDVVWASRMVPREQFGSCSLDDWVECASDTACPPGQVCELHRAGPGVLAYRDFGFINGPLLVEASDGGGGTRELVVAGAKEGVLYALEPGSGSQVWSNQIMPEPGHGGQGYFSGALGHKDGRFFAALSSFFVSPPAPFQQIAMDETDGSTVWTRSLGPTYSAVGVAGDVVFSGSPPGLVAQDPASGAVLARLELPAPVQSAPTVVDGVVYIGWGSWLGDAGGVHAFAVK